MQHTVILNPLPLLKHNDQGHLNTVITVSEQIQMEPNILALLYNNNGKPHSYNSKFICPVIFIKL